MIIIYLGGDISFLVALLVFPLQLLLDVLGQRLLSFATAGLIDQPVRSLFNLRLAVNAHLGSFDIVLSLLVLVTADTAQLSLLGQLAGLDSDVHAVEGDGQRVLGGAQLDNLVGGLVDVAKDNLVARLQFLQLDGADLLFLAVDDNLDVGALGDELDLGLAEDDLGLTLAFGDLAEHNSERLELRAVSGHQVVAPVQLNGQSLVIEGLQGLAFDLADGVQGGAGDLLGNALDVVDASLQGDNVVQTVGQTDLPELDLFLGPVDGQVEGGGTTVEPDLGGNGDDRDGGNPRLFSGHVHPQERPHGDLQVGDNLGLVDLNMGNVVVPETKKSKS